MASQLNVIRICVYTKMTYQFHKPGFANYLFIGKYDIITFSDFLQIRLFANFDLFNKKSICEKKKNLYRTKKVVHRASFRNY